jgi:molybdopterin-guanine dinucleotide biosynthesis protein A
MHADSTAGLKGSLRGSIDSPSVQADTSGMRKSITGVILAGGASRRMGADKSFLDLGGRPIITHVIDALTERFSRVIIITNDPDKYARFGLPLFPDVIPGIGTLGGIHAGLSHIHDEAAFFVASDMPFVKPEVIDYLVGTFHDTDAVIPCLSGYFEPLLAVYSKRCLTAVERALAEHKRRPVDFLGDVRTRMVLEDELSRIDPESASIFNINTPQDYERAQRRLDEDDDAGYLNFRRGEQPHGVVSYRPVSGACLDYSD